MILSAPKSTSSSKKENTVNGWFHSYAKFTPCDARSHPLSVKACANSFAEITEFLTQIRIWQRQNYSCTSARISSRQQHRLSSPYPFHRDLLGWDSATMTESPRNSRWGADPGGEPWGAGERTPPCLTRASSLTCIATGMQRNWRSSLEAGTNSRDTKGLPQPVMLSKS